MQPEKIGHYEIKSELGRGGMATVYRAYDPRFEREVAVKVLPSEMLHADPNFRLRFEREAKIIAKLEHPSIVPVYDVGEENNQPYFVMRYMNGGSLADRIRQGVFTLEQAARLLEQIAPGLDEAHAKGIIHRDLKPSNILFTGKDIPCISDFGIAKLAEGSTMTTGSAIIGTPAYMSPEQAAGNPVDGRTDIYALGIILYEMLTGSQPYHADTPMGIAIKHITEPVPNILEVNPSLPPWVEDLIARSMAKDPKDRFQTAAEMVDTFKEYLANATTAQKKKTTALRSSPDAKTVVEKKKRRFKPAALLVSLLVLGFLGVLAAGVLMAMGWLRINWNSEPPATAPVLPLPTVFFSPTVSILPTQTLRATETLAPPPPVSPMPPTPSVRLPPVIGGADKIALLRGNDIWVINVDGTNPQSLTNDGAAKFNLQWLPDGRTLIYISGMTLKMVDIENQREDIITRFLSAQYFDSFRVSPDGKQAAITLDRELFVVPFDPAIMKNIRNRADLMGLNGCLFYDKFAVKDARWSKDGKKLAIKILVPSGNTRADAIRILDIQQCQKGDPIALDDFPVGRFPFKNTIVNYDWDGDVLFFFNSDVFKKGFGDLVFYNSFTHKFQKQLPIENTCCYRDAIFSPDGTYVIFAFQDIRLGEGSMVKLYYVPVDALTTGGALTPIPLPDGFFSNRDEAPMFALRPAK